MREADHKFKSGGLTFTGLSCTQNHAVVGTATIAGQGDVVLLRTSSPDGGMGWNAAMNREDLLSLAAHLISIARELE